MLDVLAQPDTAGVGANGDVELRREEKDRDRLVDATDATGVELADVDRLGLEELLEHHPVLDVLAGRDADRGDVAADARVAEHVVRARRFLDPPRRGAPSVRIQSIASPTSQRWFASIIRIPSGRAPADQRRAAVVQARSPPTFIFTG